MEKKSATLEVDMSAVTMQSPSKAKAVLGKGDCEEEAHTNGEDECNTGS